METSQEGDARYECTQGSVLYCCVTQFDSPETFGLRGSMNQSSPAMNFVE